MGQAARSAALGLVAEANRRQGRAYVYGLAEAELGLVMASRATDATRFYVTTTADPDYQEGAGPEEIDPQAALAGSWARSGAGRMALEVLEDDRAVARLAAGSTAQELAARREQLLALGRGDEDAAQRAARAGRNLQRCLTCSRWGRSPRFQCSPGLARGVLTGPGT